MNADTPAKTYRFLPHERWAIGRISRQLEGVKRADKRLLGRREEWGPSAFELYCAYCGDGWLASVAGLTGIALAGISRTQGAFGVIGYAMFGVTASSASVEFVRNQQKRREAAEFKRRRQQDRMG